MIAEIDLAEYVDYGRAAVRIRAGSTFKRQRRSDLRTEVDRRSPLDCDCDACLGLDYKRPAISTPVGVVGGQLELWR